MHSGGTVSRPCWCSTSEEGYDARTLVTHFARQRLPHHEFARNRIALRPCNMKSESGIVRLSCPLQRIDTSEISKPECRFILMFFEVPDKDSNAVIRDVRCGIGAPFGDDIPIDKASNRILDLTELLNRNVGTALHKRQKRLGRIEFDQLGIDPTDFILRWTYFEPNVGCGAFGSIRRATFEYLERGATAIKNRALIHPAF